MYKIILILFFPILLYSKLQVTTTFPLESYILKQLGQKHIRIKQISKEFNSKKIYLTSKEISRLSSTDVYFHFGFNSEIQYSKKFLLKNSKIKIADMSKGIEKNILDGKTNHFVWMDPLQMRKIAQNIYNVFIEIDKFNKDDYLKNLNTFLDKIDNTFLEIKASLSESEIFNIIVFDEDWYYFAKRFGLNLYRYEKKNIKIEKISLIRNYTLNNNIKGMLINSQRSYSKAKSLLINSNVKIVIHDIFKKEYFKNLLQLSNELSNK